MSPPPVDDGLHTAMLMTLSTKDSLSSPIPQPTSCLGGFVIPSEEEAFARATAVFASLKSADPNVTWVYQGYPWFRVYSQGHSCNQTALRLFVRGFTRAIPAGVLRPLWSFSWLLFHDCYRI